MRIFLRVAELTSFTRAADSLHLPKATVSQAVQQLEALTGVRLLQRTTRQVSLTQDGLVFYDRCRQLVADLDELETLFRAESQLAGRLRVDLPVLLSKDVVVPRLPEFLHVHPGIELEISATDRRVDIVAEGFDCVLRAGYSADPGMTVRTLAHLEMVNCVSAGYAARHGLPQSLEELSHHWLVHYAPTLGGRSGGSFDHWDGEAERSLAMKAWVTVSNSETYRAACLAGLGLIQAPRYGMAPLLRSGQLVEVLPRHRCLPLALQLVSPHRRDQSARVHAFMQWLAAVIQEHLVSLDVSLGSDTDVPVA